MKAIKQFFRQLFCKHNYKYHKLDTIYENYKIYHKKCKYCDKEIDTMKIL